MFYYWLSPASRCARFVSGVTGLPTEYGGTYVLSSIPSLFAKGDGDYARCHPGFSVSPARERKYRAQSGLDNPSTPPRFRRCWQQFRKYFALCTARDLLPHYSRSISIAPETKPSLPHQGADSVHVLFRSGPCFFWWIRLRSLCSRWSLTCLLHVRAR